MIENIRSRFTDGIKPLYDYLGAFSEFKEVLQLNPDEFTRNLEMMDNPWEVEEIKAEIFKVRCMCVCALILMRVDRREGSAAAEESA